MTIQDLKQKLVIGLVECGSDMFVGDLVRIIPSKYNKYVQEIILEKELIGMITGFKEIKNKFQSFQTRRLAVVQWSDGSVTEINSIYLEVIDEQ